MGVEDDVRTNTKIINFLLFWIEILLSFVKLFFRKIVMLNKMSFEDKSKFHFGSQVIFALGKRFFFY